jgi:hypothetical protein
MNIRDKTLLAITTATLISKKTKNTSQTDKKQKFSQLHEDIKIPSSSVYHRVPDLPRSLSNSPHPPASFQEKQTNVPRLQ